MDEKMNFNELFKDSFLEELFTVEEIKNTYAIGVQEDDIVLGEMSDLEKRLYALANHFEKMVDFLTIKLKFDANDDVIKNQLLSSLSELTAKEKGYRSLIWARIHHRFSQDILREDHEGFGIRKDYIVVGRSKTDDDEGKNPMQRLFEKMRGTI